MSLRLSIAVLTLAATPLFAQAQRWPPPPTIQGVADAYPAVGHGGNYMHNYYFPPAPSSTPWAPAWAPDGKSIAVALSGSIWRVDPETGIADELTSGPGISLAADLVARRAVHRLHRGPERAEHRARHRGSDDRGEPSARKR